jgi:hypothetical protein
MSHPGTRAGRPGGVRRGIDPRIGGSRPGTRGARLRAAGLVVSGLVGVLGAAAPAAAERVEVEAVGVAAAGAGGGRRAALEAGVREAVLRVARDVVRESGAPEAEPDALLAALGNDAFAYAASYSIREDRGEQPARLLGDPAVEREHVVIVAAQVERGRVRAALEGARLLGGRAASPAGTRSLVVTIDGLESYTAWKRVAAALGGRGAPVRPVEFARGRVVVEVETAEPSGELVARLERAVGDALALAVVARDEWNVQLEVRARQPAELPPPGIP